MQTQEIILNEERQVTLTAYIQQVKGEFTFDRRPAILVLPGGGYSMCSDREADPVATAYLKAGYHVFILRYTLKQFGGWPLPLNDYEQSIEYIKNNAEKWCIYPDKIAVVGFSAGGHLAACAATMAKNRPAAVILGYPGILPDILDMCQPNMPNPAKYVSIDTSPCFIVATRDDYMVPIQNTLVFEKALADKNIAFESHIYSYGQHGFSTGEASINMVKVCPRLPRWIEDSIGWLKEVMGELTTAGITKPLYSSTINGNFDANLSVNCTLGHMRKQSEKTQQILTRLYKGVKLIATERGISEDGIFFAIKDYPIKDLLLMIGMQNDAIEQIDKALQQIPNIHDDEG
jgi:predicted esterase